MNLYMIVIMEPGPDAALGFSAAGTRPNNGSIALDKRAGFEVTGSNISFCNLTSHGSFFSCLSKYTIGKFCEYPDGSDFQGIWSKLNLQV